jgi:hypothetical protein
MEAFESRQAVSGSGVSADALHLPCLLPYFNCGMLLACDAGSGNGVAIRRTIYDLRLDDVIIAPDEK